MFNKIIVFIGISVTGLYPQSSGSSAFEQTASNIYKGISESITWYDIPISALFLSKNMLHTEPQHKIISFSAFDFDYDLQGSIGRNGRVSLGSMDPNTIPFYIIFSSTAITLGGNLMFPESFTHEDYQDIFLFYKSIVYTQTLTEIAKNVVKRKRPDRSDTRSFFSGHTSITFAAATYLFREMDDRLDNWLPSQEDDFLRTSLKTAAFSVLYGWAGYVAYSRIHDNKHYLSDVLLGAAAGTLISNLVYGLYNHDEESVLKNVGVGFINDSPAVSLNLAF